MIRVRGTGERFKDAVKRACIKDQRQERNA